MVPDMKTLTARDLNRNTASIMDALERGASFELRRSGRTVGYLTQDPPSTQRKPDWKAHFEWLRSQPSDTGTRLIAEFEEDRRKLRAREKALENPL
jgi:antitoxin (DNA-binding transcriptional repressor) of toxin-antitoxin stability system